MKKLTLMAVLAGLAVSTSMAGWKCVKVSDYGYDAADATEIIQKALDSGASRIIIDAAKGPWTTRPLVVRSNTEVVFEEGAQLLAKPGEFMPLISPLVRIVCATNVTLRGLGKGATLRMRITDYQNPPYQKSEWRHALTIKSSKNVLVENLLLADSGGDGIYLGVEKNGGPCENITIRRCVCDNNNRQGISVISAKHLLIEDTVMKNTRGTNPKAGIDFEPNNPSDVLIDCVMRNCLTTGNDGAGYEMYLGQLTSETQPVTITFENCRSVGDSVEDRRNPLMQTFDPARRGKGLPKGGFLKVKGCTFQDSPSPAVSITDKPEGVMDVTFEDCVFANCATSSTARSDVLLSSRSRTSLVTGGVTFRNVTIRKPAKGEWLSTSCQPWTPANATAISGDVTVCADGVCEKIILDDAWRQAHLTGSTERYALGTVLFDPEKVRVVDTAPGQRVKLSPLKFRDRCDAIVYAAKPGPITFVVQSVKVGRHEFSGDNRFIVKDMAGREVAALPAPTPTASERTFNAQKAGFYRITCKLRPHALVFTECDAPLGFLSSLAHPLDIFKAEGSAYFSHSAGGDATFFCGGCGKERVTVRLLDPNGTEVRTWKNVGEWGFQRIAPESPAGLWRIELARPDKGFLWDDSFLDMAGAPSVFFLSSEKHWLDARQVFGGVSTRVGAVNWDCSVPASTFFGNASTRALGPAKYRDRTPYYAHVTGPDSINYRVRNSEEYDQELRYAIEAGIDYFAYCWYDRTPPPGSIDGVSETCMAADGHLQELTRARELHAKSMLRDKIGFCAILVVVHPYSDAELEALAEAMKDRAYEKVGNRPLVYSYIGPWQEPIGRLRAICRKKNVAEPYIVLMQGSKAKAVEGIDALSAYACPAQADAFADLMAESIRRNDQRSKTGLPVIPHFTVGWDPSPRIENPVPWATYSAGRYSVAQTQEDFVHAAESLKAWIDEHPESTPTGHILAFAWNEFEEGGWICPNIGTDGKPDARRVRMFRAAVDVLKDVVRPHNLADVRVENGL